MRKIHKKTENKTKDFININSKEHKKTDVVWKKNVINKIKHKIQSLSNKIELNLLFKHFFAPIHKMRVLSLSYTI